MTINQKMRAPTARPAHLRKHYGMSCRGTNPRPEPDTRTVTLEPSRARQQILSVNRLRGDTGKPQILTQLIYKNGFVPSQVVEDFLHQRRFKQNQASQGIAKVPIN
jgi:hypothetical protein